MRRLCLRVAVIVAVLAVLAGCGDLPPHLTVSALKRADPKFVPTSGKVLVRAVVTEVRLVPVGAPGSGLERLAQLSDDRGQDVWVSGFDDATVPGQDVWTEVFLPPVSNDVVALVYRSDGWRPEPERELSAEAALGWLVGIAALVSGLGVLVASLVFGMRHGRRCGSCGRRAEVGWLTCPACGYSLVPLPPPTKPEPLSEVAAAPGKLAELGDPQPAIPESARPTRLIPGDPEGRPAREAGP